MRDVAVQSSSRNCSPALIWCSENLSSKWYSSPEECFVTDTNKKLTEHNKYNNSDFGKRTGRRMNIIYIMYY